MTKPNKKVKGDSTNRFWTKRNVVLMLVLLYASVLTIHFFRLSSFISAEQEAPDNTLAYYQSAPAHQPPMPFQQQYVNDNNNNNMMYNMNINNLQPLAPPPLPPVLSPQVVSPSAPSPIVPLSSPTITTAPSPIAAAAAVPSILPTPSPTHPSSPAPSPSHIPSSPKANPDNSDLTNKLIDLEAEQSLIDLDQKQSSLIDYLEHGHINIDDVPCSSEVPGRSAMKDRSSTHCDIEQGDLWELFDVSRQTCTEACGLSPFCGGAVFTPGNGNCYLKHYPISESQLLSHRRSGFTVLLKEHLPDNNQDIDPKANIYPAPCDLREHGNEYPFPASSERLRADLISNHPSFNYDSYIDWRKQQTETDLLIDYTNILTSTPSFVPDYTSGSCCSNAKAEHVLYGCKFTHPRSRLIGRPKQLPVQVEPCLLREEWFGDRTSQSTVRPTHSVIMGAHLTRHYIKYTLRQLFKLTTESWELVLVFDDSESDDSIAQAMSIIDSFKTWPYCPYRSTDIYDQVIDVEQDCLLEAPRLVHIKVVQIDSPTYEVGTNNIGMLAATGTSFWTVLQDDQIMQEYGWNTHMASALRSFHDVFSISARCADKLPETGAEVHPRHGSCDHDKFPFNMDSKLSAVKDKKDWFVYNRKEQEDCLIHVRDSANRGPLMLDAQRVIALGYLDEVNHFHGGDDHDLHCRGWVVNKWVTGHISVPYFNGLSFKKRAASSTIVDTDESNLFQRQWADRKPFSWINCRHPEGSAHNSDRLIDGCNTVRINHINDNNNKGNNNDHHNNDFPSRPPRPGASAEVYTSAALYDEKEKGLGPILASNRPQWFIDQ